MTSVAHGQSRDVKESAKAEWLLDLLQKLGDEDDAYHAVALVLMEYDKEPPVDDDTVNEPATGPGSATDADAADDDEEVEGELVAEVDAADADRIIRSLPEVRLLLDRTPEQLHPARFLQTTINPVLSVTPVDYHVQAQVLRANPRTDD